MEEGADQKHGESGVPTVNDIKIRPKTYASHEVCKLVGITYRQLDYWLRVGIIVPSCKPTPGSGGRRRFTLVEVQRLKEVVASVEHAHATIARFRSGELWRQATGEGVEVEVAA